MGLDNYGEVGAEAGAGEKAEKIGIRQWIAKQRLKTCAGDGERSADNDAEKNAREADILDDQDVVGGDAAALVEEDTPHIAGKRVKRNRNGAEFDGDDHNAEENQQ